MALEHEALTERIIRSGDPEVHRRLGPGFLESVYEKALIIELKKRGIAFQNQMDVIVVYDAEEVGRHRLDLFVEDTIVVDLKAIKDLDDIHFAIVRSQLKAVHDRQHGSLLLNFAKTTAPTEASRCFLNLFLASAFLIPNPLHLHLFSTSRAHRRPLLRVFLLSCVPHSGPSSFTPFSASTPPRPIA